MDDLSSCCREAGLIKNVVADPEYFCNGEIVTLTAEGDYDDIAWFIVDGPTWTPIPATGPINATADVNIQAIGKLSCGIADTSAVLILMHDKTDPIFSNCPINLSVDTDPGTCEYLYSFGTPVATDNCAPPTVSRTDVNGWNSGDALPVGFHVFSYLATDEGGGTATCSYQVSVKDGEAPSAVGPANVNVIVDGDCQYAVPDIRPLLSLSDNCTAEANLFFSQLPISGTLVNGDSSVNFTVIDEADNVYNGSLSLTAVDTISPQFGILPVLVIKPVDAGCNYVLQDFTTTFSGTDNCSASNVLTLSQSPAAGTVFNGHGTVQEVTLTLSDESGNTSTGSFDIQLVDNIAPIADNVLIAASVSECSYTETIIPTATDNCAGTVFGTTTDPLTYSTQGTYTINWLFEDGNGNSTMQTQLITIDDTTAPVPDAPSLPTITGECSVNVATTPTAMDNCVGTLTASSTDPMTYSTQGSYTITWLYEDGNGNSATQTQTVIVDDVTTPVPDVPSLPTLTGECSVSVGVIPTATDNCVGTLPATSTDPMTYSTQGTYTITWLFEDGNGNSATQSQTVIVDDTTTPVPDVPSLSALTGDCSVSVGVIPTATDNCAGTLTASTTDPMIYSTQGTYTITWLYEDGNGNSTTQTQTIIVDDTTAPLPDAATLPTASGECSVTVSTIPAATDNCSGAISGTTSDPLTYGGQGTYTITWLYEDGNGNSTTQTQIVIVDDTMPPVPDVPTLPTASGECLVTVTPPTATDGCQGLLVGTTLDPLTYNSQGSYTITWSYDDGNGNSISQMQTVIVDDLSAPIPDLGSLPTLIGECSVTASLATATDNCQGAIVGSTMDPLTYIVQGTYIITWTYEDGNGNSSQQAQTIIVDDTSAPVPDAASLPVLNGECSVEVLSTPTATDDCEGAIIGTTSDPLSYSSQGTYTITWTFDDGNGNISQQSQTIVVNDTTGPVPNVASLPYVSGECMATVNAPSALDNCEGVIIATTTDPITYTTQGTFSITWIYDDGHGNTSTQDQTVIVQDTEDPIVLTSPSTIQRTLDANCAYVLEDLRSLISVTDACDTDLDIVQNPSPGLVITGDGTLIALTFIISDDAGNNVSTGFTLELEDITAPAVSCPAALIIAADAGTCGAEVVFNDPIATDACGTASVIRIDGLALNSGDIFPVGMTVLTYQAADESGNTSTCTLSILVQDQEGPIISGPTADEPAFNENCGTVLMDYAGLLTYSDGCTPFADLIATQSPVVGATITGPTLVTVTIIDGAGNASDHDILVTPQDVTPPVFNAMDDLSRSLGASCQYLMEDFTGLIGVSDNCSPALTLSQFPLVNTPFFGHGTIVPVTIYAEDASGNIDSLTFSIGLEDNTPPSIICPNDTTVYSSVGSCEVFIDMEVAVAMDACQTVSSVNNFNGTGDASDFYPLGNTIISWSTTDDQNFLSTCVQMVTVIDTVAPVIEEISEVVVDMFGCTYEFGDFTSYVMASDNCTEAADLTIDQDLIGGQISGPTYLEFIVTDASGNSSISGFNVVPVNVVAPVMDCYGTLTAVLPEGDCEMEVNIPAPLATDDCGDATVTNTDNGTNSLTLTLGLGDHDVTWIATDAEGNSSECLITVTVTPEVPVNMVCPENISTVASATECGADLVIGQPEVNGFCSFVLSNDFNGTSDASGVYGVGTTEVIFTATGSTEISCSFTVEILDITVPTVICPQAIEQCGNTVDVDTPEWSDACGISSLVNDFNGLEDASGEYPSGETIITWTATDLSGNTNSCTTMVNITEIDIIATAGPDAILDFYFDHQLQATLPTGATGTWSSENEALSFSDVNDPQATVTGLALGNNVLTWTVDHGLCGVMEDEVNVLTREFLIPNGFSPNGDNVNDTYVIRGLATLGGVAIQVFDRWGLEVYASDDYDNSWDGVSPMGKTLPTGTYFYIITLKERNEILRGSLELKR
ncbi:MAG: HYR domain-containing protein [Bacteroidetes bacterium]|nr:HYR domain-containing protein [Bacteroidota bacterium]